MSYKCLSLRDRDYLHFRDLLVEIQSVGVTSKKWNKSASNIILGNQDSQDEFWKLECF